jgi:hypothetical protein
MYEIEMLNPFVWLSNIALQTIIYRIGATLWKQEYSLSYRMIGVKILPVSANFKQVLRLPIAIRFKR